MPMQDCGELSTSKALTQGGHSLHKQEIGAIQSSMPRCTCTSARASRPRNHQSIVSAFPGLVVDSEETIEHPTLLEPHTYRRLPADSD
eukprot:6486090-Amphidinium_carterae.1